MMLHESPLLAENCLPLKLYERLLTRKPTLILGEAAAISAPYRTLGSDEFIAEYIRSLD